VTPHQSPQRGGVQKSKRATPYNQRSSQRAEAPPKAGLSSEKKAPKPGPWSNDTEGDTRTATARGTVGRDSKKMDGRRDANKQQIMPAGGPPVKHERERYSRPSDL
jgi:hypothetical protein